MDRCRPKAEPASGFGLCLYDVLSTLMRTADMRRVILGRIRETSGMQTDLDQLAKLTAIAG